MEKRTSILFVMCIVQVIVGILLYNFFRVPIHEFGHLVFCKLGGGVPQGWWFTPEGGQATCFNILEGNEYFFLFGGIGFEMIFASLLIIVVPISILGSIYWFGIGNALLSGAYVDDFGGSAFLQFPINIIFFILCVVVFAIGVYINVWFWDRILEKRKL